MFLRFISYIVYLWLMFLPLRNLLGNLSGFLIYLVQWINFYVHFLRSGVVVHFHANPYISPIAQREYVCIFTEAHCVSLGFLWLEVKD